MYKQVLIAAMAVSRLTACFALQAGPPPTTDGPGTAAKVHVLSAAQMSREDAEVIAAHRRDIAEAAEVNGYDLGTGSWIRNQVVCPDAPRHVLMHYLKINQDGSLSQFTAAVPRSRGAENLRVRIVPVLYHGAQAFHMFGSSPSQRQLMDEVVSAQPHAMPLKDNLDWTTLAYCYAGLAGAEPRAKSVTAPEEMTPLLSVSEDGKLREMRFSVVGPEHLVQSWNVEFDKEARVKGIYLSTKPASEAHQVVQALPAPKEKRLKEKPIPEAKPTAEKTIPAVGPANEKPIPPQ
ncbi:hypothetical protein [Occallatibacter riparius]|uniref:DUF1571 domain-containing protein n=1 Tax=Occallatibacter riparius TaxID=1002689 RepID=A0A9J7BRG2_9BACT|nr:hypothetical protein [Occallatibacter riparius]UWZ85427.1 hypothetical protein MOP44_05670 [Occallatibacter riparius]